MCIIIKIIKLMFVITPRINQYRKNVLFDFVSRPRIRFLCQMLP